MRDEEKTTSSLDSPVRTRFAPSPTGYLHLGNARIALINYVVALQSRGAFLLRMEDTDPERSRPYYVEAIKEDLKWMGLSWRGEVVFQSQRMEVYRRKAWELWEKGLAYPCFCTREELEAHRQECMRKGRPPRYSGRCRGLSQDEIQARVTEGEPFSLRFRVDPRSRVRWRDVIKGSKRFRGKDLDDIVLLRADGTPTYHLAVVVDDGEMGITHVIRGEDHLANTPYHILLFEAFGYPVPAFAHVPLVRAPEGEVLEKREGGPWTLKRLREEGYLPLAVFNLLIALGWNPPHKPPITWGEVLEAFSLEEISSSTVTFSPSTLVSINRKLIATAPLEEILGALEPFLPSNFPCERLEEAVALVRENTSTLVELAQWVEKLVVGPGPVELTEEEGAVLRALVFSKGEGITWLEALEGKAREMEKEGKRLLFRAVRKALLGLPQGPPMKELIAFLGERETSRRLADVITDGIESSYG